MSSHPHLPLATEYADRGALKDVRDASLVRMAVECSDWADAMDDFRGSLVTPAALVLWRVLISNERKQVSDALDRVVDEISTRNSDRVDDAVPAPGEDAARLDIDSSGQAEDEHVTTDRAESI